MRHLKTTRSSHYFYKSKIYDFVIFYSIFVQRLDDSTALQKPNDVKLQQPT